VKNKIIKHIENHFSNGIVAYNTITSDTIDENEILNVIMNSTNVEFTDGILIVDDSKYKLYSLSTIDYLNI
jgi:hypothetical protein